MAIPVRPQWNPHHRGERHLGQIHHTNAQILLAFVKFGLIIFGAVIVIIAMLAGLALLVWIMRPLSFIAVVLFGVIVWLFIRCL